MENKKVMWIIILLITISVYRINADEQKILLQAILITNYPEYFFIEDEFSIIGNIYKNINKYTIVYNKHFWGNGRMTGRLVILNDYTIVGHYGVLNETPEIENNRIIFKEIKSNENYISFDNGIPETILINGELYPFVPFNNIQTGIWFSGKIHHREYYGPPNFGEDPINDSIENRLVLVLDESIIIYYNNENKVISEIQLILQMNKGMDEDKKYYISGEPFTAHTGHHHTEIILVVEEMNEAE
jgi:hypothetical protein